MALYIFDLQCCVDLWDVMPYPLPSLDNDLTHQLTAYGALLTPFRWRGSMKVSSSTAVSISLKTLDWSMIPSVGIVHTFLFSHYWPTICQLKVKSVHCSCFMTFLAFANAYYSSEDASSTARMREMPWGIFCRTRKESGIGIDDNSRTQVTSTKWGKISQASCSAWREVGCIKQAQFV